MCKENFWAVKTQEWKSLDVNLFWRRNGQLAYIFFFKKRLFSLHFQSDA